MLFNSLAFFLFLIIILALYYFPAPWTFRKTILVLGSYIFYASGSPHFLILLIFSSALDWNIGGRLRIEARPLARRLLLFGSIATNLGVLGFYKYGTFISENLISTVNLFGYSSPPPLSVAALPIGISFYTFQSLSYSIDVYRNKKTPYTSLIDFLLYVGFFPQLVAGPIVRSGDFLPQCLSPRVFRIRRFYLGLVYIISGLTLKVVFADFLMGPVADSAFATVTPGVWDTLSGLLSFSHQIYFDFAGYSMCARGAALCLGFRIPVNFKFPFAAASFSEFWSRWHISLSQWLRDYLYIPLGGNRFGRLLTLRNLMFTMLLGGLWHGASWKFIIWGGIHGLFLVAERTLPQNLWNRIPRIARALIVFILVTLTWSFFRAKSTNHAIEFLGGLFRYSDNNLDFSTFLPILLFSVISFIFGFTQRDSSWTRLFLARPWWVQGFMLGLLSSLIVMLSNTNHREFIYFQF